MKTGGHSCFHYRLPRFPHRFPLELLQPTSSVGGRCLNLSETGLLAQLEYPVVPGGPCTVRLILPAWTVDLEVELTYTDGCHSGFRFLFQSEQQRQFVRAIVQSAA